MTQAEMAQFLALAQRPDECDLAEAAVQLGRLEYPAMRDEDALGQLQSLVERAETLVQASA